MSESIYINGLKAEKDDFIRTAKLSVYFTSDNNGETMSVNDGSTQFTFAFEEVQKFIDKVREKK